MILNRIIMSVALFLSLSAFSIQYNDGDKVEVGDKNPVKLKFRHPKFEYSAAQHLGSFDNKLGKGDMGTVYSDKSTKHAIKMIHTDSFDNVQEIEAGKIAGELKVGPGFFDAWVTEDKHDNLYVAIEMEEISGNALSFFTGKNLTLDESLIRTLQNLFKSRKDGKTYFFDRLFKMLLDLAENKVSYGDPHSGNIMIPNAKDSEDMRLVDFGHAKVHESSAKAAFRTLKGTFVKSWIELFETKFDNLPDHRSEIAKKSLKKLQELAQEKNKE